MKIEGNSGQSLEIVRGKHGSAPNVTQNRENISGNSKAGLAGPAGQANAASQAGRTIQAGTGSSLSHLLTALKLPQDNLSRSIIAFARFFSLPLNSKFLNGLRSDVLNQPGKEAFREAAALGKAAAADKGLKLGDKALREYAAAIEGSIKSFAREDAANPKTPVSGEKEEQQGEQDSDNNRGDNNPSGGNDGGFNDNEQQNPKERQTFKSDIENQLTEILKEKPMLDFINRIPGKKGQWIVIPFLFTQNGFEFNVSLRILLYDKASSSNKSTVFERLTVDLTVKKKKQSRWFISLERPKYGSGEDSDAVLAGCRVSIFCEMAETSLSAKNRLRKKLAKALNIAPAKIRFPDKTLLFADSREDHLLSVDEEV